MERERSQTVGGLVLVLDAVVAITAMGVAFVVHHLLRDLVPFLRYPPRLETYTLLGLVVLPVHLSLTAAFDLHRTMGRRLTPAALFAQLLKLHLTEFIVVIALVYVTQSVINRSLVGMYLACSIALTFMEKTLLGRWWRFQQASGQGRLRIVVVADASPALRNFLTASAREAWPPEIVGRVGEPGEVEATPTLLGAPSKLGEILHAQPVDRVVFLPPYHEPGEQLAALETCETLGIPALFALEVSAPLRARPTIGNLFEQPFVVFDIAPKSPQLIATKHAIDFVASAVGVVVLAPLFAVVALAILVTMGRPVLFVQERAGLFGRRFRMLKFRTMVADAESQRDALLGANEMSGPVFKITNDPRVTRLGRFLRRSSIDELPQLFNVLAGSMSLVGPRPLPIREQENVVGWHRRRLSMKPGLTCLWQVSGRSDVNFEGWMQMDLDYVDEWSLLGDFVILLWTVPAVLFSRGAR